MNKHQRFLDVIDLSGGFAMTRLIRHFPRVIIKVFAIVYHKFSTGKFSKSPFVSQIAFHETTKTVNAMTFKSTYYGFMLWISFAGLISCSEPESDEAVLHAYLNEVKAAVEDRSVRQIQPFLSETIVANNRFDKAELTQLMRAYFFKYQSVNIFETNLDVMLNPSDPYQAAVQGTVLVSGGDGDLLPQRARLYELEGRWLKEQGKWRLVSLDWK